MAGSCEAYESLWMKPVRSSSKKLVEDELVEDLNKNSEGV